VAGGLNAKFHFVKKLISELNPTAFFISEANINKNKINEHLNIDNYELIISDTKYPISRSACYLRKSSGFDVITKGNGSEIICLESKTLVIAGIYRPFKLHDGQTHLSNFNALLDEIKKVCKTKKEIVVAGDFNIDVKVSMNRNPQLKELIDEWALDSGLVQKVNTTTRSRIVTTTRGERIETSIIDHFYTSNDANEVELIEHFASDHKILMMTSLNGKSDLKTLKLERRDWRRYRPENIKKFTESVNGQLLINAINSAKSEPAEILLDAINNYHREVLNHLAPIRIVRTRRNTDVVDSKVSALKKQRDRLLKKYAKDKGENRHFLLKARDIAKEMKKRIKSSIRHKYETKASTPNQKAFWNVVKEINFNKR